MVDTVKHISRRLIDTRKALGFSSQAEFCKEIGVEKNVYNPFEKGKRRITVDVALKIRKRFNIPLDWIYAGDPAALPVHVYRQIGSVAA
jgi:transcriptional regulator with XRE-family HTH domain